MKQTINDEKIEEGNRIEVLEYEFAGKQGNVEKIIYDAIAIIKLDDFQMKVAIMLDNLKKVIEEPKLKRIK
jgi:hypothetical protein